ncbi:MAG TPA: hypothetical protein VFZ08_14090 [Terriglobia bacterium]|nr:hypothetical protein [Terriglobia bacterium]
MPLVSLRSGKALSHILVAIALVVGFASLSYADIIYASAPPDGVSSFTVDGSAFQFETQSYYQSFLCPGPDGPQACFASSSNVYVTGGAGVSVSGMDGNLAPGEAVSQFSAFQDQGLLLSVAEDPSGYSLSGSWRGYDSYDLNPGYLGFRVQAADGYHYGWALADEEVFSAPESPNPYSGPGGAVALEYAFESCPGQAINAGATSGGATCDDPPDPAPEPATATLLALGLAGIEMICRRLLKFRPGVILE